MAMQKDIEFPSGVVATYHRVMRANADFTAREGKTLLSVEVGCYLNEAARRNGKLPVMTEHVSIEINGGEPSREAVYAILSRPLRMVTQQVQTGYDSKTGQPTYEQIEVPDPATFTKFNDAQPV
jgi:hypothetical protein